MKHLIVAATMIPVLLGGIESAQAKTERTHSGGSYHSSGTHRTAHPRVAHARAAKPTHDYVVVKCKTKACLKKHPSGTYGFVPKKKA